MPQISRQQLNQKIKKQVDSLFIQAFALPKPANLDNFLNQLFTYTEKVMLTKRLAIAHLLIKGYNYRNISQILKVSSGTINRIAVLMQIDKLGIKAVAERLNQSKSSQNNLESFISQIFQGRSGAYRELRRQINQIK
ncbi:hypothetical protein A3B57_02380 [Microgenomates group bacterium RIFCSPLOWO2_01_FULL_47_10]|nr:MAG: hypothetical protein A3B57_02380 [Microgenomates group bacterium RIFCSPLOWO2_01_FULL_47_10]